MNIFVHNSYVLAPENQSVAKFPAKRTAREDAAGHILSIQRGGDTIKDDKEKFLIAGYS